MDDDGIPELVEDCFDYWVNVYSYSNGQVYTAADEWGYSIQWEEIAEGLRLDVKVVKALDKKQKIVVY